MKTDLLADRHIGIQEEDLPVMLEKIGVKSLDELPAAEKAGAEKIEAIKASLGI